MHNVEILLFSIGGLSPKGLGAVLKDVQVLETYCDVLFFALSSSGLSGLGVLNYANVSGRDLGDMNFYPGIENRYGYIGKVEIIYGPKRLTLLENACAG